MIVLNGYFKYPRFLTIANSESVLSFMYEKLEWNNANKINVSIIVNLITLLQKHYKFHQQSVFTYSIFIP